MPDRPGLAPILAALGDAHPDAGPPAFRSAFEIVLFENVAYLVSEDRRQAVWRDFCERIGTDPFAVMAADPDLLEGVLQPGGMHPERRARKIRDCCAVALDECDGDLDEVLARPAKERRKALKRFPGFGDPGVDKILMLSKTERVLALDSNGLRVLLRSGFGAEAKSYSSTYRSVQADIAGDLPKRADRLIRAHFLLREHGRAVCKNSRPRCEECCLADGCPSASV